MKALSFIIISLYLLMQNPLLATSYVFNGPGDWSDASLWSPNYPGTTLSADDDLTIIGICETNMAIMNEGAINVEGSLVINGPGIFVNFVDASLVVIGDITVNNTMYNQGNLTINGDFFIDDLFLNFSDLINNGTIYSNGEALNNSGNMVNAGTFIDNAGFFEQGTTDHTGAWEGNANHMNDDFVGNGSLLSPNGDDAIGTYTFFSDLTGEVELSLDLGGPGAAGTDYDQVIILNDVDLNLFSLSINLTSGYNPQAGDSFVILNSDAGIIGDIVDPTADLPVLDSGLEWNYENNGSDLILSVSSTVAVDLSKIEVEKFERGVELSWKSYSEINHDYFRIERSFDAVNWDEIGHVKGSGQSYSTLEYSFFDSTPLIGENFYRLVSVDLFGSQEISEVVSCSFYQHQKIRIWPQIISVDEPIYINVFGLPDGIYQIHIYNVQGKKVGKINNFENTTRSFEVDLNLAHGKYFISFLKDSQRINKSFFID